MLKKSINNTLFLCCLLLLSNTTAAQTDSSSIALNIFPNPNNGTFYITLVDDTSYPAQLVAIDGRVVKTFYLENGLNYLSVNVPSGLYLLTLRKGEKIEQFKVRIN